MKDRIIFINNIDIEKEIKDHFIYIKNYYKPHYNVHDTIFTSSVEEYLLSETPYIIMSYGREMYDIIYSLYKEGKVHIGLRKFSWSSIKSIPVVSIGVHRVIFLEEFDWGYKIPFENSTKDIVTDIKIHTFYSDFIEKTEKESVFPTEDYYKSDRAIAYIKGLVEGGLEGLYGFDYETYGFPNEVGFKVTGIGLSNLDSGVYIDTRYFDEGMEQEFNKIFKVFLEKYEKQLVAFNTKFENNVSYIYYGAEVYLQDSRVLCIADELNKNLKYCIQYYFSVPSYDDYMADIQASWDKIFEILPTYEDYVKYTNGELSNVGDIELQILIDNFSFIKEHSYIEEDIIRKYYGNNWSMPSTEIIGKYCIYDSYYSLKIYNLLYETYKDSYNVYLKNMCLSGDLEMSAYLPVNTKRLDRVTEINNTITRNIHLYFNFIYLHSKVKYLEDRFTEEDKARFDNIRHIIEINAEIFLQKNNYFSGKEIIKKIVLKEEVGFSIDRDTISTIYKDRSEEVIEEIYKYKDLEYQKIMSKKALLEQLARVLFEIYPIDYELIERLNVENLKELVPFLKEENEALLSELRRVNITAQNIDKINYYFTFFDKGMGVEDVKKKTGEEVNMILWNIVTYTSKAHLKMTKAYFNKEKYEKLKASPSYSKDIREIYKERKISWDTKIVGYSEYIYYFYYKSQYEKYKKNYPNDLTITDDRTINEISPTDFINYNSVKEIVKFFDVLKVYYEPQFMCLYMFNMMYTSTDNIKDDAVDNMWEAFRKHFFKTDFSNHQGYIQGRKILYSSFSLSAEKHDNEFYIEPVLKVMKYKDSLNTKYPLNVFIEDEYQLIQSLYAFYDIQRVSVKEVSTYLKPIKDNIKYVHKNDKGRCQVISSNEGIPSYHPSFYENSKKTKRWWSGFHTFIPSSDAMTCFEAPKGKVFVYFDISQAEPRLVAFWSKDKVMSQYYLDKKDIYMEMLKNIYPKEPIESLYKKRQFAKILVLAQFYGMSLKTTAKTIGISADETQKMIQGFFGMFKNVKTFIHDKVHYARKERKIDSFFGDKITVEAKDNVNTVGINWAIQNGAAIMCAEGFHNVIKEFRKQGRYVQPVSVVHDSSTFLIDVKDIGHAMEEFPKFMSDYLQEQYGVRFEFDLNFLYNLRDKIEVSSSNDVYTFTGQSDDIKRLKEDFSSEDMSILEDRIDEEKYNKLDKIIYNYSEKKHDWYTNKELLCNMNKSELKIHTNSLRKV